MLDCDTPWPEGYTHLPTLVIRNVEDSLHARLKKQAAAHERSMKEEVPRILRERLAIAPASGAADWVDAIRALFEPLGGLDLREIEREKLPDPPDFSERGWDPEG